MPVNFSNNFSMLTRPQDKTSRNSLFEVGLLVIICVLFVWFIILPKKSSVDIKKDSLSKLIVEEGQISDKQAKLQTLLGSLESDVQDVNYLDQAIPLDGNTVRLRLLVQNMADSVGVTVGSINISGGSGTLMAGDKALLADPYGAGRKAQILSGTLNVLGSFDQLQVLLKKLENSGRLIDVSDLAIDQGSGGSLSMTLSFKSYYFAP